MPSPGELMLSFRTRSFVRIFYPDHVIDPLNDPAHEVRYDLDTPVYDQAISDVFPLVKTAGEWRRYWRRTPKTTRLRAVEVLGLDGCISKVPVRRPRASRTAVPSVDQIRGKA